MIKANEGEIIFEGTKVQVLLDFAHIFVEMINIAPEIVQGVAIRYQDDLMNAKVDPLDFAICNKILNAINSVESEDEDDESSLL